MYEDLTEIKTLTDNILGETMNEDIFYQLANIVVNKILEERDWMFLRKRMQLTGSTMSLPDDFKQIRAVKDISFTLTQIDFDQQDEYDGVNSVYYLDYENNQIVVPGTLNRLPYMYYIKTTEEVTSSVDPVFPSRFWPRIAFDVVGYFQNGMDADDIYARMSPENKAVAIGMKKDMAYWDAKNQSRSKNGQIGVQNTSGGVALENM